MLEYTLRLKRSTCILSLSQTVTQHNYRSDLRCIDLFAQSMTSLHFINSFFLIDYCEINGKKQLVSLIRAFEKQMMKNTHALGVKKDFIHLGPVVQS